MPETIYNSNNDDKEVATKEEVEEAKETVKKRPWTRAEDDILREHVKKYGEGNWHSVQKNFGLARCGKSCRLRWANHLRPDLKRGEFSEEEEQIIVHLHAQLGNKWSRMAAKLPGRTDNEIKNFWNTRIKRCQRAGLPIYPPEVLQTYLLHPQYFAQPHPNSSSFSFSSFLSPPYHHQLNYLAAYPQQNHPADSSNYINPHPQFKFPNENSENGNYMGLPLSPVSPYGSSSSSSLFNQSFAATDHSRDYHSGSYNYDFDNSFAMLGSPYESLPLVQGSNMEVSSQSPPPHGSITTASSYASGVYGLVEASSMADNGYYEVAPLSPPHGKYSGLLDDLVVEAQKFSRNDKSKSEDSTTASNKRKSMVAEEYVEEKDTVLVESSAMKNSGNTINKTQRVDSNSSELLTGEKLVAEDTLAWMNPDDGLFSLLNNFPSEMPVPEWYHKGERQQLGLETQQADAS